MQGEWIEIFFSEGTPLICARLSPCRESGLKSDAGGDAHGGGGSLPMQGEWIEMYRADRPAAMLISLSPCRESGLKCCLAFPAGCTPGSLPMQGEWIEIVNLIMIMAGIMSLPMQGEWIEIVLGCPPNGHRRCLSPCRESGLKYHRRGAGAGADGSLPMQGEWIEISIMRVLLSIASVSPHAGRVD